MKFIFSIASITRITSTKHLIVHHQVYRVNLHRISHIRYNKNRKYNNKDIEKFCSFHSVCTMRNTSFKVIIPFLIFIALTCVHSSSTSGALYEQGKTTVQSSSGRNVCITGKEELKANSQIECTLKCRLRQKSALVGGSHGDECTCYKQLLSISECEEENRINSLEGKDFVKMHVRYK